MQEGEGVLRVDLSRPEQPDEIGRLALEGQPTRIRRHGDQLWVTGREGGLTALRLSAAAPSIDHRLWLPYGSVSGR